MGAIQNLNDFGSVRDLHGFTDFPFCREFGLTPLSSGTPLPPIAVPGRVAYGLQRLLPKTTNGRPCAPNDTSAEPSGVKR